MSSETLKETVLKQGKARGKLELWAGVLGSRAIDGHLKEHARNRDAQGRMARKQIGEPDAMSPTEDDMGHTILGDVTNPTPVVVNGGGLGTLGTLAAIALGVAIPGAGVGGYLLAQALAKPDTVQPADPQNGERVEIGLGRIEDYLKAN